jgi:hypothetical protein
MTATATTTHYTTMTLVQGPQLQNFHLQSYSSEHGSLRSPLLNLPGELRNETHYYVLGRRTCDFDRGFGNSLIEVNAESDKDSNQHHTDYPFSILEVCRQTHDVASLLPFILNTSRFRNPYDLCSVDCLNDAQRCAVNRIPPDVTFSRDAWLN